MLALTTTTLGTIVLPVAGAEASRLRFGRPTSRAFIASTMPALDLAFGRDDESAFPDAIAELVARLHAGPLGRGWEGPTSCVERGAAAVSAEAVV